MSRSINSKVGLLKQQAGELSYVIKRATYSLSAELARHIPRQSRIDALKLVIEQNQERLRVTQEILADLQRQIATT